MGVCFHCELQKTVGEKLSLMVSAVRQMALKLLLISMTGCGLKFFRWLVLSLLLSFRINTPKSKCLFSKRITGVFSRAAGKTGQQCRKGSPGEDAKKLGTTLDYSPSRCAVLIAMLLYRGHQ